MPETLDVVDRDACRLVNKIHYESVALTPDDHIERFAVERLASKSPMRIRRTVLELDHGVLTVLRRLRA